MFVVRRGIQIVCPAVLLMCVEPTLDMNISHCKIFVQLTRNLNCNTEWGAKHEKEIKKEILHDVPTQQWQVGIPLQKNQPFLSIIGQSLL